MLGYKAPKKVRYKGVEYKVHNYWLNILQTILLLEEEQDPYKQPIILVHKIFGTNAPIEQPLIDEALLILNNGQVLDLEQTLEKPLIDLEQDFNVYRMDIKQYFSTDIEEELMSWQEFLEHVAYVSAKQGSSLNTRVRIRDTNPNDVNKKDRRKFVELQKSLAIKKDKGEKEPKQSAEDYWANQMKLAKEQYKKKTKKD